MTVSDAAICWLSRKFFQAKVILRKKRNLRRLRRGRGGLTRR
ncbi:hypothetical protein OIU79_029649 [Salix purpurea]|uniref:Uncharacterized protein n=1 Tax=Salix purpurea TaxID=77065 RepID=A0A9Q0VH31_SALPP|nr:hypothetical protein OIU79_029649 [Salix purpurea]